jgi:hypothetical protein
LIPVLGLLACAYPVMSLGGLLGGIEPMALTMAFLVALAVAVLGCVLALVISVWAVRTQDVLMAVYSFWTLDLLVYPIWWSLARAGTGVLGPATWTLKLNPVWLSFAPYLAPNQVEWTDFALFLGGSLALSAALTVLAIARLRPVTAQQASGSLTVRQTAGRPGLARRLWRRLPGPSLDGNPVLWREWHRRRPGRLARLIWWVYFSGVSIAGVYGVPTILSTPRGGSDVVAFLAVLIAVGLGHLLLSVSASTSLSEERTRGSLDVLLATPLPTRTILWGKWWGAFRIAPLLAFWPTMIMAAFAFSDPRAWAAFTPARRIVYVVGTEARLFAVLLMALIVLTHAAAVVSMGLALATWVARQGRAAGLCVAASVLVSIGWIALSFALFDFRGVRGSLGHVMAMLSPLFAALELMETMAFQYPVLPLVLGEIVAWLIVVAGAAAIFLVATFLTFDRCLGRMPAWEDEFFLARRIPTSVRFWLERQAWRLEELRS